MSETSLSAPRLILASGSPRRREYLSVLGLPFEIIVPDVDESARPGEQPADLVARLSALKADAVARAHPDAVVVAADTLVTLNGEIMGKPADADDAFAMIMKLSGHTHIVYTAVTIRRGAQSILIPEHTEVTFATLDEKLVRTYIASGESFDKSGSYALQGIASMLIERVNGSVSCVVGLPICQVREGLRSFGLIPRPVTGVG